MNKRKVATVAVKGAARHPAPTVHAARFAVRHRQGLLKTARQARKTKRVFDEGFRTEMLAGMSALQAAANRTQKVGASNALQDKQVNKLVKEAAAHTTAALRPERRRKRHSLRTIAIGAAVTAVAAIAIRQWLVSADGEA